MEFHNDIKEQIKSDEKRNKSIDEDIKGKTTERIQKKKEIKMEMRGKKLRKPIYFTQKKICCFLLSIT